MPLRVAPWTLLVALVPLFWVTVYPPEPAEERLGRWLDLHPEQVASAQACKNAWELVRALPEKRIPGALLPHDSLLHWALAPLSALLFLGWILVALPRGGIGVPRLAIETLRTAILGTCFLWICQYVVENPGSGSFVGTSYEIFFIYLMFFLAYSYASALNPESGFWMSLFGFTFGVGLCEELCKIWPVTRQVRRSARGELHDLVVLGLVSGVGLGSAEALTYCGNYYHGFAVGETYVVRLVTCVALHGIWTGLAALRIAHQPLSAYDPFGIGLAMAPSMMLHGAYDTLLKRGWDAAAMAVAVISAAWFLGQYTWMAGGRGAR